MADSIVHPDNPTTSPLTGAAVELHTVVTEPRSAYLRVRMAGQADLPGMQVVLRSVAQNYARFGLWRILIEMERQTRLSLVDWFDIVINLRGLGFEREHAQLALVMPSVAVSAELPFIENVAVNRDWNLKVFVRVEDALDWLGMAQK